MTFDPNRYKEGYLQPLARAKVTVLADDLPERYAITMPASDHEVAATVRAVRAVWASQQRGTKIAKIAKLCIGADDLLKQEHGEDLLTSSWWQRRLASHSQAADAAVEALASTLTDTHGGLGCVTLERVEAAGRASGLGPDEALRAALAAGLRVLEPGLLPERPPLSDQQYRTLESALATAGVQSVVHLIHPRVTDFTLLERFAWPSQPKARLDGDAVVTQQVEAERLPVSSAHDARRMALQLLKTVAKTTDLRSVSLQNLVQIAQQHSALGPVGVRRKLLALGLDESDASAMACLVIESGPSTDTASEQRVEALLAEGRLPEAAVLARQLPASLGSTKNVLDRVEESRRRYDALVDQARRALADQDEVRAVAHLQEAARISSEEAGEVLSAVPMPPPLGLAASTAGGQVSLHWGPNLGYSDETSFLVRRGGASVPTSPVHGTPVPTGEDASARDARPPVARQLQYAVFAQSPGRPVSRPASIGVVVAPSPADLRADTGADQVTVSWTVHPETHQVMAHQRLADGQRRALPVTRKTSVEINGLPEGQPVSVEIVAEYRSPDGQVVRSEPRDITAVPRAAAKQINVFRAIPRATTSEHNVTVQWLTVDYSDVRIRAGDGPAPWALGANVTSQEFASWGQELKGRRADRGSQASLEVRLPEGRVTHLVPFSVGGTGIVVGRSAVVGVSRPVEQIRAERFGSLAKLSWIWPDGITLAEVSWERDAEDEDAVGLEQVKKSDYVRQGGFSVPLGESPTRINVCGMMTVDGHLFRSSSVQVVAEHIAVSTVRYQVQSGLRLGPFGGRTKKIIFSAEDSAVGQISVVVAPGPALPNRLMPDAVVTTVPLKVAAGRQQMVEFTVPRSTSRPYWVRCFVLEGSVRLVDPPFAQLKEN